MGTTANAKRNQSIRLSAWLEPVSEIYIIARIRYNEQLNYKCTSTQLLLPVVESPIEHPTTENIVGEWKSLTYIRSFLMHPYETSLKLNQFTMRQKNYQMHLTSGEYALFQGMETLTSLVSSHTHLLRDCVSKV